jgi:hypothetical protein
VIAEVFPFAIPLRRRDGEILYTVALIKSGQVVNDPEQDVTITIGGHSNPGHKPTAGYANDMVSVYISQVTRQANPA